MGVAYLTGETVIVRDAKGGSKKRKIAKISIAIGGSEREHRVTLASWEKLDGKGSLAINLRNSDDFKLLEDFRKSNTEVVAVETRSQKRNRLNEECGQKK